MTTRTVKLSTIKARNKKAGRHFFSEGTMSFFASWLHNDGVEDSEGNVYFVTSEQFVPSRGRPDPRKYTVRVQSPDGDVSTHGEFQAYATLGAAEDAARAAAAAETKVVVEA